MKSFDGYFVIFVVFGEYDGVGFFFVFVVDFSNMGSVYIRFIDLGLENRKIIFIRKVYI